MSSRRSMAYSAPSTRTPGRSARQARASSSNANCMAASWRGCWGGSANLGWVPGRARRGVGRGEGIEQQDVGPVNSLLHLNRTHEHVATAAARGNAVLAGGSIAQPANAPGGWFYRPTVIEARSAQDPVVQEEIFGPVLVVQQADDLEQAIALANGTDYALV